MSARPTNPVEYRNALGIRPFSPRWTVFTKAVWGVPLDPDERPAWAEMSGGRSERPGVGWFDVFANVGRGGGKDDWIKSVINYECRFGGHEIAAAPGQRIPALVICPLRNQAVGTIRQVQGEAHLTYNARHIKSETATSVEYKNGCVAQVQTADDVAVAGDTLAILVFNEVSLMPGDESASPLRAIENNARPAMRRVEGAPPKRLIRIGSSYITEGRAWELYRDNFGRDDSDVLVVRGSSLDFNPNLDREWLAEERRAMGDALYAMHYEVNGWRDAVLGGAWSTDDIDASGTPRLGDCYRGFRFISLDPIKLIQESKSPDRYGVLVGGWDTAVESRIPVRKIPPAHTGLLPDTFIGYELTENGSTKYVDVDPRPYLRVDFCEAWEGKGLTLEVLEQRICSIVHGYGPKFAFMDYGGDVSFLLGLFRKLGVQATAFPWSEQQRRSGFEWVGRLLRDRRLYAPQEVLRKDLGRVQSILKPNDKVDYRAARGADGHADTASCLVSYAIAENEGLVQGSPITPPNYRHVVGGR